LFYLGRRDDFRLNFNRRRFRFLYFFFMMNNGMDSGMFRLRMRVNRRGLGFRLRLDLCRMMRLGMFLMMDDRSRSMSLDFLNNMRFYFMSGMRFLLRLDMGIFDRMLNRLFFLDNRGFMQRLNRFFDLFLGMHRGFYRRLGLDRFMLFF